MEKLSIQMPYGDHYLSLDIPKHNLLDVIYPSKFAYGGQNEAEIIRSALQNPIGSPRLRDLARRGKRIAILTSDITRPCPSSILIPPIIEELTYAGIPAEDIFIVIGLGLHRPMQQPELKDLVSPEIYHRFPVINHDLTDTVYLGTTSSGTPVEFFRPVVDADLRVCLGVIEFHWYAGYSGGAKALLPGCGSRRTITTNHALMTLPGATTGMIDSNPLRMDLEEGASMLGVDFILNVVMDSGEVVEAVAGDVTAAHRKGCEVVDQRGKFKLPQKTDIVIASPGGFPKDINLFQAHKGLENASHSVREGGALIFLAECREGLGNLAFESWMLSASELSDIYKRFQAGFEFGGHKAVAFANILRRATISLVSNLPDELVKRLFLSPYSSPQEALENSLNQLGRDSKVLILPSAVSTLPEIDSSIAPLKKAPR